MGNLEASGGWVFMKLLAQSRALYPDQRGGVFGGAGVMGDVTFALPRTRSLDYDDFARDA